MLKSTRSIKPGSTPPPKSKGNSRTHVLILAILLFVSKAYRNVAITMLSSLLLFVFALIVGKTAFYIKGYFSQKTNLVSIKYNLDLTTLYSGMSQNEINQLLNEFWLGANQLTYESLTGFRETPFEGHFVNITSSGFRKVKNQAEWPPKPDEFNIFVFGGSTTFGYEVADWQTIPSYLQEILRERNIKSKRSFSANKVNVYNFGRGAYVLSQELILFEKLLQSGHKPDIVIFVDGLNDFALGQSIPYSEKYQFLTDLEKKPVTQAVILYVLNRIAIYVPKLNILTEFLNIENEHSIYQENRSYKYDDFERNKKEVDDYKVTKKLIESVANDFDIETLFVMQPIPTYKYNLQYQPFKLKDSSEFNFVKNLYSIVDQMNKTEFFGYNFLWLGDMQENLSKSLYVDAVHYSPEMSKLIAEAIAERIDITDGKEEQ